MDSGVRSVESWLAKMGFPPRNSKRSWLNLPPELKASLPVAIDKWAKAFCLPDLRFPSFALSYSYEKEVMAADVVHAVAALLECDLQFINPEFTAYSSPMLQSDKTSMEVATGGSGRFWSAWQALEPK